MKLRQEFESILDNTQEKLLQMPWEDLNFYSAWLAQQYFLVRHTPRLLVACAARCSIEETAGFTQALGHLKEEAGHDLWLLQDLRNLGFEIGQFTSFPLTEALIQMQYYQIQVYGAVALLGYAHYLELLSVVAAEQIAERVENRFGPRTAVFLRGHATADVKHTEQTWNLMQSFAEQDSRNVAENLRISSALYQKIFLQIKATLESQTLQKAAS